MDNCHGIGIVMVIWLPLANKRIVTNKGVSNIHIRMVATNIRWYLTCGESLVNFDGYFNVGGNNIHDYNKNDINSNGAPSKLGENQKSGSVTLFPI